MEWAGKSPHLRQKVSDGKRKVRCAEGEPSAVDVFPAKLGAERAVAVTIQSRRSGVISNRSAQVSSVPAIRGACSMEFRCGSSETRRDALDVALGAREHSRNASECSSQ